MAATTFTSTLVKSGSLRDIHAGIFAAYGSFTCTATPSASQTFLMLPIPDRVTVLDGWVKAVFSSSFSMDLKVGWIDDDSLFMAATEVLTNKSLRFNQGLPHTVTITDSDTFPLAKPLVVTIAVCASGTLTPSPVISVMALLQRD